VFAAELPWDTEIPVRNAPTAVLELAVPAGAWLASASVAVVNRGGSGYRVDVWVTATGYGRVAGPRAAQGWLMAGEACSVTLGPVFATLTADTSVLVVAQTDGPEIYITEGTDLLNRAGATGLLVWGGPGVFSASPAWVPLSGRSVGRA